MTDLERIDELDQAARLLAIRDREIKTLREALGQCAAIVDSFLNGQGAATQDEMDTALQLTHAALAATED